MRFSISGIAAVTTSPTICRLFALTWSRSSCARVPRRVVEVDDVDRGDAGSQERDVVVFDRRSARWRTCRRDRGGAAVPQMMSTSQGVEFESRLMSRSRSPIMSSSTSALRLLQRPVLLRRLHVVSAAVGVVGAAPFRHRASSPSRKSSSIVSSFCRGLEDPPQLEQRRG